jgi:UDP-N-acetylmuramoylalanine--D-glutamate ligase
MDPGVRSVLNRLHDVVEVDDSLDVPLSQLYGEHNAQLVRVALATVEAAGIQTGRYQAEIAASVASFTPLPHRLEPVGEIDGVLYVNDSLSTNPIAASAAVRAFEGRPISLLLGGYERGLDFDEFGEFLATVPGLRVFTMPECGRRIAAAIAGDVSVTHTEGLREAVQLAHEVTPKGGVVLLAPAAASFSEFKNYAERGDMFRSIVGSFDRI